MIAEHRLERKLIRLIGKAYYKKIYDKNKHIKEMIDYIISVDLHKLFTTIDKLEEELNEKKVIKEEVKEVKKEVKTEPKKIIKPVQEKKVPQEKKRYEERKVNKLLAELDKIDSLNKNEFNFFNKRK